MAVYSSPDPILWLNGRFLPARQAAISPFDRGFLYGDGVFETMRAEQGCVLYAGDHLRRLYHSLDALRIDLDSRPDWHDLLRELLERNQLMDETASVKIIATRGACPGLGLPQPQSPTVCLMAQQYRPPADEVYQQGWRLEVFRDGFSPPLAKHKSLNYLYFLAARQAAMDAGADEAVILDPNGRVTETAAGSLIARTADRWWTPANDCQLAGITVRQLSRILAARGTEVDQRPASLDDILAARTVWVLNSLMGIMPAREIAGHTIKDPAAEEAARLRKELFHRGTCSDPRR